RSLLERDPHNADAYRAVYTLFLQQQAYDEAWCAASVLAFIGKANEEERRFFDDWRAQDIPNVSGTLDKPMWRHLSHREEDERIGRIFEAVSLAALKAKIAVLQGKGQLPIQPEQARQDPQTSTGTFP